MKDFSKPQQTSCQRYVHYHNRILMSVEYVVDLINDTRHLAQLTGSFVHV